MGVAVWIWINLHEGLVRHMMQPFGDEDQFLFERVRIIVMHCFLSAHSRPDKRRTLCQYLNLCQIEGAFFFVVYRWNQKL